MRKAVIISCFDWYEKRIKYVELSLAKKEFEIQILTSDYDHLKKEKICKNNHKNIKYIKVPKYKHNISVKRIYSHMIFVYKVLKEIKSKNIDLIYCLIPPNYLIYKIIKRQRNSNTKIVVDIIDMWPESMPHILKHIKPLYKYWRLLRNNTIGLADFVILECDLYKNIIQQIINPIKMGVLYVASDYNYSINSDISLNDELSLCYLGSINSLIDIKEIARVISFFCKNYTINLHIIGDGEKRSEFLSKMDELGINVFFYGQVFDFKIKEQIFNKCHFGINIYKEKIAVGLTLKSIEYFNAGLPILNNIQGDTYQIVEEYKIGINIDKLPDYLQYSNKEKLKVKKFWQDCFSDTAVKKQLDEIWEKIV